MTEIRPDRQGRPDRVAAEMLAQGRALRRRHNLVDASGMMTSACHDTVYMHEVAQDR